MTLHHDDRGHFHPLLLPLGTEKRATRIGSRLERSDGEGRARCGTARVNCEFCHRGRMRRRTTAAEKQSGEIMC